MWPDANLGKGRVLALRMDNIGDVVMTGPALRSLRQGLPNAHLTFMCSPAGSQVTPMLPWIDEVWVHRAVWQDASAALPLDPQRELTFIEQLRQCQFDAALIFTSFSQSPYAPAYACYLAGIPIRVGQAKDFGGSALTHWVQPPPFETHQVDRNLFLLESLGFESADRELELHLPDLAQARADHLLRQAGIASGTPFILVAPGASCPARVYDPRRFGAAAKALTACLRWPVVVVGSSREADLVQPLLDTCSHSISLVGQTTVPELCGIVRRAGILLASHSGPMHIADALHCPMVISFSGTDLESQWRPRQAPAVLLRRPTPCAPCYGFRCPYAMECVDIPPNEVAQEAKRLLQSIGHFAAD